MNEKLKNQIAEMKKQTIGIEVEMNNITRSKAAKVAAEFFGTGRAQDTASRNGCRTWSAWDAQGREWKFQRDSSIHGPDDERCEMVTPILTYADIWYACNSRSCDSRSAHYNESRYHMLNLHNTFTKGTIEFRLFQFDAPADGKQNGLHAGQLKSYIQLCLALSQMAKTAKSAKSAKSASPKPQQTENPKYAMRTWLLRLGFIGEEFATARDVLTRRLAGNAVFRSGRGAA